jgi:acyl-CoA thioesterase
MSDDPESVRARAENDPYCDTLGIELVEMDAGRARTELTVDEDHRNFHGTVHGGAIYSLADAAFAAASNSRGETAFALETNISYLDMTETGTTLAASATETHDGRRTAEYRVDVTADGGERIATFRGRVYKPDADGGA